MIINSTKLDDMITETEKILTEGLESLELEIEQPIFKDNYIRTSFEEWLILLMNMHSLPEKLPYWKTVFETVTPGFSTARDFASYHIEQILETRFIPDTTKTVLEGYKQLIEIMVLKILTMRYNTFSTEEIQERMDEWRAEFHKDRSTTC